MFGERGAKTNGHVALYRIALQAAVSEFGIDLLTSNIARSASSHEASSLFPTSQTFKAIPRLQQATAAARHSQTSKMSFPPANAMSSCSYRSSVLHNQPVSHSMLRSKRFPTPAFTSVQTYLDESNILTLLAETLPADVQAVFADQTG